MSFPDRLVTALHSVVGATPTLIHSDLRAELAALLATVRAESEAAGDA
ncbi:MAG: hypothetical protein AAGF02_04955 [Actinomycetota bacterium]